MKLESKTKSIELPNATEQTSDVVSNASISDMSEMLNIDEAIARLRDLIKPIESCEEVNLEEAVGRVLSESIVAPVSLPPFNSSAMDGYAVRSKDCQAEHTTLSVIGTSFAGKPFTGDVPTRSVVRIFTGAAVPNDCDAVVLQEDVQHTDSTLTFSVRVGPGDNIRHTGHDVAKNEKLLDAGTKLTAFEVSWLAACGIDKLKVAKLVRVAVFSTGDELQDPGEALAHGQIYDSNRATLNALLQSKSVSILDLGRLADNSDDIEDALKRAIAEADLIVTSGGVSVGDADLVRPVVERLGDLKFWNVALKPGKPIAVATIGDSWFLGLPGNPVSTIVTYLLFVSPTIDALSGRKFGVPLTIPATLTETIKHSPGRREYQRGVFESASEELKVKPTGDQSSNRLTSFANANCLIVLPEDSTEITAGTTVDTMPLPREACHLMSVE